MMWVLVSAKGSPGVTTTALALAAVLANRGDQATPNDGELLVEADPAGGDLECWCGPHGESGLLRAVTDVRDSGSCERFREHAVEVVPGVSAVLAPTTEPSVTAGLRAASDGFAEAIAALEGRVIIDLGRWIAPGSIHANRLVADAAVVAVLCRSALASVEHARSLIAALRSSNKRIAVVMVVRCAGSRQVYR